MKLPKTRKACSDQMIHQFQDPNSVYNSEEYWKKRDAHPTFNSQWWTVLRKDGSSIRVQGLNELKYAKYLIVNDIDFICHPPSLPYIMNGKLKQYRPDFYVPSARLYIEIKSDYTWKESTKLKMQAIKAVGYNILVLSTPQLRSLF